MILLGAITVLSVVAFFAILLRVDPAYADGMSFALFYGSVFAASSGITAWALMVLRAKVRKVKRPLRIFSPDAIRQALLVGGILTASLLLQSGRHLSFVWVLLIVALAFGCEAWMTRLRVVHVR